MKKLGLLVAIMTVIAFAACGGGSGSDDDNGNGNGGDTVTAMKGLAACDAVDGSYVLCGTVYAVDGETPVAGATIAHMTSSSSVSASMKGIYEDGYGALEVNNDACESDDIGQFACQCDDCSDSITIQIQSTYFGTASQVVADATQDVITNKAEGGTITCDVECNEGETCDVPASCTTPGSSDVASVKWLVVPGSFDGIQLLLSQLKGCTLTGNESVPQTLTDSDECLAAGLKIISSGSDLDELTLSDYQAVFANCDADYSGIAEIDTAIQNYVAAGGNMYFSDWSDDWLTALFPDYVTFPSNKKSTTAGTLEGVSVVDTGLQVFLGSASAPQTTMDIIFDIDTWVVMDSVVSTWTTYIQGDVSPLAPSFSGTRPITVGGQHEDGCLFYTSYHVEGAASGSDQEKALRYMILNRMNNCN